MKEIRLLILPIIKKKNLRRYLQKKIAVTLMAIILVLGLAACGKKNEEINIPQENIDKSQENLPMQPETPLPDTQKDVINNEDVSKLSNKKLSWSFKKGKNHEKPTFDKILATPADKYGAIYLNPSDEKKIYLTFDEGYENGYTAKILDTLKEYNVKATFFITGPYLKKEEALVKRMVEEGHTIGNHTINHPSMPDVTDDTKLENELLNLDRQFYEKFGTSMKYLRPPMGEFSERTLAISKELGYTNVFWSFAYKDWEVDNQKGTEYAKETVLNSLHPGAVLLLHAVSKDNANALGSIIQGARDMEYEFGVLEM